MRQEQATGLLVFLPPTLTFEVVRSTFDVVLALVLVSAVGVQLMLVPWTWIRSARYQRPSRPQSRAPVNAPAIAPARIITSPGGTLVPPSFA